VLPVLPFVLLTSRKRTQWSVIETHLSEGVFCSPSPILRLRCIRIALSREGTGLDNDHHICGMNKHREQFASFI
jgi:hypothetical protein